MTTKKVVKPESRIRIAEHNELTMQGGFTGLTGHASIEEGVTIESDDGSWSHPVTMEDKTIVLRDSQNGNMRLDVVKRKNTPSLSSLVTTIRSTVAEAPVISPGIIRARDPMFPMFIIGDLDTLCMNLPCKLIMPSAFSYRVAPLSGLWVHIRNRSKPLGHVHGNEAIAVECLREMLSEQEYRKYITHRFVLVKGQSGKTYQILRDECHVKVWNGGIIVEEVCIYIKDHGIPPTDKVVAFKTMIETDEGKFRSMGNVYKMTQAEAA